MDWTVTDTADACTVRAGGRIDETNWEIFTDRLVEAVRGAGGRTVVLDLSALDYITSRGLRGLSVARDAAAADQEIVLAAPNARIRAILSISRYDKIFRVMPA